jgi:ribulose-bisphosphate carboxylase large chain
VGRPASRLRLTYELAARGSTGARQRARDLAREQTVEVPPGIASPGLERRVAGRVEAVTRLGRGRFRVAISYPPEVVGESAGQLWNLLYGNISLQGGVRLAEAQWPAALLRRLPGLPGPRHGLSGVRAACGAAPGRALLCGVLKPLGLDPRALARRARDLARGGVDLVKDDHNLADQRWAPFAERVARCQEAVERANAASGGRTLYLPHLGGGGGDLAARLEQLRARGCRGALVTPLLVGAEGLAWLARESGLVLLAHPALSGAFFGRRQGIAPEVLLGDLFRLGGADGVVYPNAGGRFPIGLAACRRIHARLRAPLGAVRPAFPVLGGGIDAARLAHWMRVYGPDTIFLIGGSIYRRGLQGDLRAAAARLREVVEGKR